MPRGIHRGEWRDVWPPMVLPCATVKWHSIITMTSCVYTNAVEAIVRGVKSGLPLNDSMRLVAKEAKEPIKSDFQRVIDQQGRE